MFEGDECDLDDERSDDEKSAVGRDRRERRSRLEGASHFFEGLAEGFERVVHAAAEGAGGDTHFAGDVGVWFSAVVDFEDHMPMLVADPVEGLLDFDGEYRFFGGVLGASDCFVVCLRR